MVESPAQFGRLKTLIHPGLFSGVHVILILKLVFKSLDCNRSSWFTSWADHSGLPCILIIGKRGGISRHQLGIRLLPELAQRIEIITRQLLRQGQESISVDLQ